MNSTQCLEVWKNTLEESKQKLSFEEIIAEVKKYDIPMEKRTIRYYATHRVIKMPMKVGKYAYHSKDYIIPALTCIFLLQIKLHAGLKKVREIIGNKNSKELMILVDKLNKWNPQTASAVSTKNFLEELEKKAL